MRRILTMITLLMSIRGYGQTYKTVVLPASYGARSLYLSGINNRGDLTGTYYNQNGPNGVLIWSNGSVWRVGLSHNLAGINSKFILIGTERSGTKNLGMELRPYAPTALLFDGPGHASVDYVYFNDNFDVIGNYFNGSFSRFNYKDMAIKYPNSMATYAFGLNNGRDIVGSYYNGEGQPSQHGFLLHAGQYYSIDFPSAVGTMCMGINNLTEIVGMYTDDAGATHGFSYVNGAYVSYDAAGAANTSIIRNNDSHVMVGYAVDSNGISRGLIITP